MRQWEEQASLATGYRGQRRPVERRRGGWLFGLAFAVLGIGAFAGVIFYGYSHGTRVAGDFGAPLIQADTRPTKVRPEQPGGMEVPHQDKLVFDRLDPEAAPPLVERLLPPPETPLPRPVAPPPPPPMAETAPAETTPVPLAQPLRPVPVATPGTASAAPAAGTPTVSAPPAPGSGGTQTAVAPAPAAPAKPAAKPPAAPPAPAATPPSAANTAGPYRIQLGSVKSEADAQTEWKRLTGRHRDLLGGLALHVTRADLGPDKGVMFRVQGGSVSEARAKEICAQLKTQNVGCLPVKP